MAENLFTRQGRGGVSPDFLQYWRHYGLIFASMPAERLGNVPFVVFSKGRYNLLDIPPEEARMTTDL